LAPTPTLIAADVGRPLCAVLLAARGQRRGEGVFPRLHTCSFPNIGDIQGMTRVRSARIFQATFLVAWALVVLTTFLDRAVLLAPAGAILVVLGIAILGNWGDVRTGLREVQKRWRNGYQWPRESRLWQVYGGVAIFVGLCFAALGVAAAI
jgi:hypothetical protein